MALTLSADSAVMMFIASPTQVSWGESANLAWSAREGDRCVASGGWQGDKPAAGSFTTEPLEGDTRFVLSCSGEGQAEASVHQITVPVRAIPPDLDFQSLHDRVPPGGRTTLHWRAIGAEICRAGGAWKGDLPTSGSYETGPLGGSATYDLQCSSAAGTAWTTVRVETLDGASDPNLKSREQVRS